jgi:hypothetical protein
MEEVQGIQQKALKPLHLKNMYPEKDSAPAFEKFYLPFGGLIGHKWTSGAPVKSTDTGSASGIDRVRS